MQLPLGGNTYIGSGTQMLKRLLRQNLADFQNDFVFAPYICSKVSLEAADALVLDHSNQRLPSTTIVDGSKLAYKISLFGVNKTTTRLLHISLFLRRCIMSSERYLDLYDSLLRVFVLRWRYSSRAGCFCLGQFGISQSATHD